jgi:serine protease Do
MMSARRSITLRPVQRSIAIGVLASALACGTMPAEQVLPESARTNGSATLQGLAPLKTAAQAQAVWFGQKAEQPNIGGVIVSSDGYLLTAASELRELKAIQAFLPGHPALTPREVKRDEKLNLLLLKIDMDGLSPVTWEPAGQQPPATWLCALADRGRALRLGVVSANRRTIPNSGAVMGVMLKGHDETDDVIISHVTPEGPAAKAGLNPKDKLLSVNGQNLESTEGLRRQLGKHQPGDIVKLRYSREGKEAECDVRLESRSRVRMGADDFANHGTSLRTDNFPEIIQHDMPITPRDIGTALYDLQGRAIGLNIARVDRVTNYALPSEVFASQVEGWIKADRKHRK